MPAPSRRLVLLLAAGLVAAGGAGWYFLRPAPPAAPPAPAGPLPLLPLSLSPYRNTGPDAKYVGSAACVRCHEGEHASYHRTGMARSTAAVDPAKEATDAVFAHAASGRRYEVVRQDGKLRHRETLIADGPPLVLNDFPLAYAVGSGRHAKTYLVEADGFLVESPASWYRSRGWGMSPGFDRPGHPGFERPIGDRCLFCHAGRFEPQGEAFHRYTITEPAVGCERCHGPGSLHVAEREKRIPVPASPAGDLTIVNPRRLSRELAEAVCQQCHLTGEMKVTARGRTAADFRPGLPLDDVFHAFLFADDHGMTITGHVEQMHASRCYQKSATLTCTTCHNPHGFPAPAAAAAHYRAACLGCHAESACKVDPHVRSRQSPENSCVTCHMPTNPTDVPHVAFSHHRIGVHKPNGEARPTAAGGEAIRPFHDLSRFAEADRRRSLGLAYARVGGSRDAGEAAAAFGQRARDLLTAAWEAGARDGLTASALARANYQLAGWDVRPFAEAALADPGLGGEERCDALFLLADDEFKAGNFAAAAELLRRVTRLRRSAVDWSYLAKSERALGREPESLAAMEEAARIGGSTPRFHAELADWYDRRGDRAKAAGHRRFVGK